jgi:arylsulfatase A-like enzyme
MSVQPHVVFVFGDQWRQQATGFGGNPQVRTPHLDALAQESVHCTHALSGCPVCSPYRASLLTGQRPQTHGVFVNDVCLRPRDTSLAEAFAQAGYRTAYIGKWHVDGHGRSGYIPPERRLGFQFWKTLECTHDYNRSAYYANDSQTPEFWAGYDALAQTREACACLRNRDPDRPLFLTLSWGPPHNPYETAPEEFRRLYDPATLALRPNVPEAMAAQVRIWLAGYYAHCSALDACAGELLATLRECGIEKDTIFVFTSDHGDLLGSHGETRKQQPWDEAIRVPFLLRYPALAGWRPRVSEALIDAPDIMPTLLGLCGIPIPRGVEGVNYADHIAGGPDPSDGAALLSCMHPFGEWSAERGGREYRGLRTRRHTYARDLSGPWLLYDNEADPFQMRNLAADPAAAELREDLDRRLTDKLRETGDDFRPGMEYIRQWGYTVDASGTVPITK